jgi:hypothetical protein
LLKDLRWSDVWRSKLIDWQGRLIKERGYQGGAITEIIRDFAFAPQRFESFVTPLFNLLLILPAVIWMLQTIALDWRDGDAKKRAIRALDAIDAQFVLDLGLIADYGAVSLRLIRRFDVHSKDPSVTRRLLNEWVEQLHQLFREGNVFQVVPSTAAGLDDSDPPSTPMTGTQIAMEQILYIGQVEYANNITDFHANKSPKHLFAEGMKEMGQVIAAAEARVFADFHESDLYMCLEIFDLDAWLPVLPLASSQSVCSTDTGLRLGRKLRAYFDFFPQVYKTIDDWVLVVAIAVRHKNSLQQERPQRNPEDRLDHRICWASAAAEIARCHPWADVPVRGYLTWIDGTGSVERALGIHAAVLASHEGRKTRQSCDDALEMCAELRLDGPAESTQISYQDRYGQDHVGQFGKECAALWLATRARRFGAYKTRKDAGTTKPVRKISSFKKQRTLQLQALDSISKGGRKYGWLRGSSKDRMADLKKEVMSSRVTPTKTLGDFIDTTEKYVQMKTAVGLWRGFSVKQPPLRRIITQGPASSRNQTQSASVPDTNLVVVEPLCAITDVVGSDGRLQYRSMTEGALHSATAFTVETIRDVEFGDSAPEKLRVWLHAIATGKTVVAHDTKQTRKFLPAIQQVIATVHFTPAFRKKQAAFFEVFTSLLQRESPQCQWTSIDKK